MATFGELLIEARRLFRTGQFETAESIYRRLLATLPQAADVWHELGLLHFETGRLDAAAEFVQRAIALAPDCSAYQGNLGAIYRKLRRPTEALACFQRAVQLSTPTAELYSNLGLALKDAGREAEALAAYDNALKLREDFANGHFNRANLLLTIGRLDEAMAGYRRAIELQPNDAEAHYRLGIAYFDNAQRDEAIACWERALAMRPNYPEARRNRALAWLSQGDYARGWAEWEYRFACEGFVARPCPEPRWDGTPLAGRALLLHTEQGLGDALQFIRYVELVQPLTDTLKVEVQAPLVPLLAASGYGQFLVPRGEQVECDLQCPLMSVPFTLAGRGSEPYWNGPYLAPSAHLAAQWKARVRATDDLQVGIAWAGNPDHPYDRFRSASLVELAGPLAIPGVRLISLQKGAATTQLGELPPGVQVLTFGDPSDVSAEAFMDTAAIVKNLDLVITVDTAIAHLAGGMGMPVWMLLQFSPDWRWRLEGHQTPWYPSMRLFRQRQLHRWDEVFQEVADQLRPLAAKSSG